LPSKKNTEEEEGLFAGAITFVDTETKLMQKYGFLSVGQIYKHLGEPNHPHHDMQKPLFGCATICLLISGVFLALDAETAFFMLFFTIVGFWIWGNQLVHSGHEEVNGVRVPWDLRLDTYLYPFDQEPPADRSEPLSVSFAAQPRAGILRDGKR